MKVQLITDTHFGHDKLVELAGRPSFFSEDILNKVGVMPEHDLLIHLGDFCIGNDAEWHERFFKLKPKNARWVLVRGNHDHKGNSWYLSHGWDFVCDDFHICFNGEDILFSHEPMLRDGSEYNVHGHFHNNSHRDSDYEAFYDPTFHRKLALEETNYRPVSLEPFLRLYPTKGLTKEPKAV